MVMVRIVTMLYNNYREFGTIEKKEFGGDKKRK
jgi:hypothetical protein